MADTRYNVGQVQNVIERQLFVLQKKISKSELLEIFLCFKLKISLANRKLGLQFRVLRWLER